MALEVGKDTERQLCRLDIQKDREFTLAQATSVRRKDGGEELHLRVGDVIKIVRIDGSKFEIALNGRKVRFIVPFDEVSDLVVSNKE